ncbi:MAG: pilus assembly protein TadG-related protein [Chloroflexota bacterium]
MARNHPQGARGQFLVLFALASTAMILFAGLTIDGGYAFAQRRGSQNASDFAALSGARVIAEWVGGDTANGTDGNVQAAITNSIAENGAAPLTFGSPDGPIYIKSDGTPNGFVGHIPANKIPFGTVGVSLSSSRSWKPFFLGVIGINNWSATSTATAKGGYSQAGPPGDVFPAGISQATYDTYPLCSGDIGSSTACQTVQLTPGSLNVPGGFGWLKFGAAGKCTGFGLGMQNAGCSTSKTFLQDEIGPPQNSYGCCTAVGLPGSADKIGSLPGNKVSADCSAYIGQHITVTVPIWDVAGDEGANAWYHIVGFAGMELAGCNGGKDISAVLRQVIWPGPTTTDPQPRGAALGVELVH